MNFLQALKDIGNTCKEPYKANQHLLRALHLGLVEVREHTVRKASGTLAVEIYYPAITDKGREFIRTVEETLRNDTAHTAI